MGKSFLKNQKQTHSLSIVMPVYNEEAIIEKVVRDFSEIVLKKFEYPEFIIINDCSTDTTLAILENLQKEYHFIKVKTNEKNLGHGPSLKKAYEEARGEYIFHCDSDNQFLAEDFWLLWEKLKKHNLGLVMGLRKKRYDPLHRRIISKILRLFILMFFRISCHDINAPFKLYSRKTLNRILPLLPRHALVPTILMVLAAYKHNIPLAEVDVSHRFRATGKTFIRSWNILIFGSKVLREIIRFKKAF